MSEEKVIEIGNRKYYSQYYVNQLQQENLQLKEEIEIKDRLIDGIEGRLKNHFRKLDRTGLEDNGMLLKIQELIKIAKGDRE